MSIKVFKICIDEARRFMVDCLVATGANRKVAKEQAQLLIEADIYGHPSHGMNRLEYYVNDIKSGSCKPNNTPVILKETPSTAWIDGKSVLGSTVSHLGMDTAIRKAKDTGIGWVTVKGSNHNGYGGFWTKKAARHGLIGLAFTNTSPVMAPTRSKQAMLGTNPIAVAAAALGDDLFYLDVATTAVAFGKIEIKHRKNEPLPPGWAQGPDGNETRDAAVALKTRRLFPLGGVEQTSGYKGFGLGAMVELFCGICSGSHYGHHVRTWKLESTGEPADIGHCFGAINPDCFAPGFKERLSDILQSWRSLTPVDPKKPVLAPGDMEKQFGSIALKSGAVTYVADQIETCKSLSKRLNVKPLGIIIEE